MSNNIIKKSIFGMIKCGIVDTQKYLELKKTGTFFEVMSKINHGWEK